MKVTATITNITREGIAIRVFADFSDGQTKNYVFDVNATKSDIRQVVRKDVDDINDAENKALTLETLKGEVIE